MIYEYEQLEEMKAHLRSYEIRPDYDEVCRWYNRRKSISRAANSRTTVAKERGIVPRSLLICIGIFSSICALSWTGGTEGKVAFIAAAAGAFAGYALLKHINTKRLPPAPDLDAETTRALGYAPTPEQQAWYEEMGREEAAIHAKEKEINQRKQLVATASEQFKANQARKTTGATLQTADTPKQLNKKNPTICPKCGSSNTEYLGKKGGVSGGRMVAGAAIGAAVGGGIGELAGAAVGATTGKKKEMLCRNCGYRWVFK